MNRRQVLLSLAALFTLAAGMMMSSASAYAQIDTCICKLVPVIVDPGVCNVHIRVTPPGQPSYLLVMNGGNTVSVQCDNGITFELWIGGSCWSNIGTSCATPLGVPGGCCVTACLERNAAGCWQIHIRPHRGPCLSCGGGQDID